MTSELENFLAVLDLESLGERRYRAPNWRDMGDHLFGGQVVAQALRAAQRESREGFAHSLHATFLHRGNTDDAIQFAVEEIRRSRAFQTLRVTAEQSGQSILQAVISCHARESGPEHQSTVEDLGAPAGETYEDAILALMPEQHTDGWQLPVELRSESGHGLFVRDPVHARDRVWLRTRGVMPEDRGLHQCVFAFTSDFVIMSPALQACPGTAIDFQTASLDHTMWFHRPFRIDEWLLFDLDSPITAEARGLGQGSLYTSGGQRVATCVQESLIRPLRS